MQQIMSKNKHRSAAAALMLGAGLSSTAFAQNSTADDAVLEEVVITGLRATLNQSIAAKRAEDHIVEVISAESIGQMPNVTVAEALVRLPGINGARDRGNESQASVRGLGPRMVMGLVNGREIASSEPNRNVRWEIIPSEVVQNVKVYKSQSADLIAGGVAATIDIGTVNPLDYTGPKFTTNLGAVYYDKGRNIPGYNPLGYRFSVSWVDHLTDNLAIALSGSTQKQKNAYPSIQGWGYTDATNARDVNGDGTVDYTPWGGQTELKKLDQNRDGLLAAVQWRSGGLEVKWDALYSKVTIDENQNQMWFNGWDYSIWSGTNNYTSPGSSYTLVNGDIVGGVLNNSYGKVAHVVAEYDEDKTLFATGLNAQWSNDTWTIGSDLSYSKAKRENTWRAVELLSFPATVAYNWQAGQQPWIAISNDTYNAPPAPNWDTSGMRDGPEKLDDKLTALTLNVSRSFDSAFSALEFGVRGADRTKSHQKRPWTTWPGSNAALSSYGSAIGSLTLPDFYAPAMLDGDLTRLANIAFGGFGALGAEDLASHWSVQERTTEGFVKGSFDTNLAGSLPVKGNIGVRVINVKTTSKAYEWLGSNATPTPTRGEHSYTEVLPSASANFSLTDDQVLRTAVAKVIARAPLDELTAARWRDNPTTSGQLYGGGGNPTLDPLRATQYDLSWEWYFHKEALLAAAAYYKDVDTTIGHKQDHQTIDGRDYLITSAYNVKGGKITGLEFTLNTPFYFIPGMGNFGIYANYAYVDSNIKEIVPTTNPLDGDGLTKHTSAVDLWYSDGTYEVRVGQKYHSRYTGIYGWDSSVLGRIEQEHIYDASVAWQVTQSINLKLQANNLTDERLRIYRDNQPDRLVRYDLYGRRYLLEASLKF